MTTLDRYWRIFATGLAFTLFGLAALLLSLVVFPMLRLGARDPQASQRRMQRAVHYGCRWFVWMLTSLGLASCELHGREFLRGPGRLIVANHPSLIDVLFLLSWTPQLDCIVKQDLWRNPFLKHLVRSAGYVGNASPKTLVEDCVSNLRAGRSLVVFPEGTRSVPGRPLVLQRGAARIALESGAEVVPVVIRCDPPMLIKGVKWYQVPERRPHYVFAAAAPFRADRYRRGGDSTALAARRLTAQFVVLLSADAPPPAVSAATYSMR